MTITPQQIKTLSAIHLLCIRINAETEYAAFYDFHGHCDQVQVSVAQSKENHNYFLYSTNPYKLPNQGTTQASDLLPSNIYFQDWDADRNTDRLSDCLTKLTQLLATGKKARYNARKRQQYALSKQSQLRPA